MHCAALREALQNPTIYPEPTTRVEVHETHISVVFLTDHFAYKIKKPVDLGFLDFTTLEQRRFYCEQELALNRRLSAGVYLEVVPIHRSDSHFTFEDRGPVVEYAVKMRRLPVERSLEALVRRGTIAPEVLQALAQRLVAFHAEHPLPDTAEPYGTLKQIRADWEENFAQTADCVGDGLSPHTYAQVQQAVTTFMTRHAAWFAQRVREGRIRDCHGDLRAEHVYIEDGELHIIDCIEFNRRFRVIDVASEVAFLVVDLQRLGAPALARRFVEAYVQRSADLALYRLLDFYCCYRAYVRGKVTTFRLREAPPLAMVPQLRHRAEQHFALAARYAARLTRPLLLLTTGLIGSGKSTIAQGVAEALDLQMYSSDRVRKEGTGLRPQERQREAYGAGLYSAAATQRTYDALADLAYQALIRGDSVILDASFSQQGQRHRLLSLAQDVGADCCILACVAPEEVLRQRLQARDEAPGTISDAREALLAQFARDYEPLQADEVRCSVELDTTQGVERCVQHALAVIHAMRP